ncbi:bactericidal permeability increasing protein [Plakobranchus ocellatus]|uniref:Bactericidal permeability increasing protein n=1 Tax=Plakobranchus ocellatus TaxID=259542 RepID=A0AAV4BML3_9GAST|nr:bactericidal permeability increasing protein [Plakobranchus ocellatus]
MKIFLIVLLCLLVFTGLCGATNPGVKVRVTKNGVNYANQVAHQKIVQQLQTLSIPDQSGKDGHISYTLTNIRVQGVTPPASSISLVPDKGGITWALSNFGIAIHADWRVKYKKAWIHISDSGSVDVSLSGVNLVETASFGIDKTGRPSIASSGCSDSIGGVDVHFHGGSAFILNLFRHTVENKIKDMLQPKICDEVVQVINNDAAKSLATMDVTVEIAKRFLLDYRLVAAPAITTDYFEILDKGEVFWEADVKESPFSPSPIPALADNSRMVYIWVTEYTPNTFFYQAQTHGYLKYNVTKDDLPDDQSSYLNTTCPFKCIGTIIPQIGKLYPNSTVELRLHSQALPKATASNKTLTAALSTIMDLYAHTPDRKVPFLATLNVNVSLTLKPSIKDEKLNAVISDHSFKLSVLKSAIGQLNPTLLNIVLGGVMDFVVIPKLNKIAAKGVQLPMVGGVQFNNTELILQEGNLLIGTDLQYKVDNTLRFKVEPYQIHTA